MVVFDEDVMNINLKRTIDTTIKFVSVYNRSKRVAKDLAENPLGSRYVIISDQDDSEDLKRELEEKEITSITIPFKSVDDNQSIETCMRMMGEMSSQGYGRDSTIIGHGSPKATNVAGMIAATFNRGIPYIQLPSVLGWNKSDISVFGNLAVNAEGSKNAFSTHKFPESVYFKLPKATCEQLDLIVEEGMTAITDMGISEISFEDEEDYATVSFTQEIDDSYDIIFGEDLFERLADDLAEKYSNNSFALVTDSKVEELYAKKLKVILQNKSLDVELFSFQEGEENKTIDTCKSIMGSMAKKGFVDDTVILALGGGVVGDAAGFMASMYHGGIPYVNIPTTTISQADSSVGGKTAVDTIYGKNLVGQFKQPDSVWIDVATLLTLDDTNYYSGLAETIKHGVFDKQYFEFLEENIEKIKERDLEILIEVAKHNCKIKGTVVEIDPHEKGLRKTLNYGHTAGHAVEKLSLQRYEEGNSEEYYTHGEAVSIGMMVAGRIAIESGTGFTVEDLARQEKLLNKLELPTTIPDYITNEAIIGVTSVDKKAIEGRARYTLPACIGRMCEYDGQYAVHVDNDIVEKALDATR